VVVFCGGHSVEGQKISTPEKEIGAAQAVGKRGMSVAVITGTHICCVKIHVTAHGVNSPFPPAPLLV
jgi:hypothetical protein